MNRPSVHVYDLRNAQEIVIPDFRGAIDYRVCELAAIRDGDKVFGGVAKQWPMHIRIGTSGDPQTLTIWPGEQFRQLRDDTESIFVSFPKGASAAPLPAGKGDYAVFVEADPNAYEILR